MTGMRQRGEQVAPKEHPACSAGTRRVPCLSRRDVCSAREGGREGATVASTASRSHSPPANVYLIGISDQRTRAAPPKKCTYGCAYATAYRLHTSTNAEKRMTAIFFFFFFFALKGICVAKAQTKTEFSKTRSGVHTFCRAGTRAGAAHAFIHAFAKHTILFVPRQDSHHSYRTIEAHTHAH